MTQKLTQEERHRRLVAKAREMRQAQKNYFKTRDPQWLRESKRLENEVDALRQGNPPDKHCPQCLSLACELADIIIRTLDYAGVQGIDIGGAVIAKMEYNKNRPYKHGKKF